MMQLINDNKSGSSDSNGNEDNLMITGLPFIVTTREYLYYNYLKSLILIKYM